METETWTLWCREMETTDWACFMETDKADVSQLEAVQEEATWPSVRQPMPFKWSH